MFTHKVIYTDGKFVGTLKQCKEFAFNLNEIAIIVPLSKPERRKYAHLMAVN